MAISDFEKQLKALVFTARTITNLNSRMEDEKKKVVAQLKKYESNKLPVSYSLYLKTWGPVASWAEKSKEATAKLATEIEKMQEIIAKCEKEPEPKK